MNATPCQTCTDALPDMLLAPESPAAAAARQHLAECAECEQTLQGLKLTERLLGEWTAPEPSPWFDQRLHARLREAQAARPEGFLERMRSLLLFSTGRQLRPMLAGAFALVLALGGGTAAVTLAHTVHPAAVEASATVEDLQILDRNDQAIQTMDQLLNDDGSSAEDGGSARPTS